MIIPINTTKDIETAFSDNQLWYTITRQILFIIMGFVIFRIVSFKSFDHSLWASSSIEKIDGQFFK